MRAAVFLDRDGVINENRADYVKSWDEFVFLPNVFEPLCQLARNSLLTIVITNQSAINRGLVSPETVEVIHSQMCEAVSVNGGRIDAVLTCPHRPDEDCRCRKPEPGLLLQAAERLDLDLPQSYLIGDSLCDIAAGLAVGCRPILVLTGQGREQLPGLVEEGYSGYYVAADFMEAIELALGDELQMPFSPLEERMPTSAPYICLCPLCQQESDHPDKALHQQMNLFLSHLDERQRRWYVALESKWIGHGGDHLLSQITGLDEKTIRRGRRELDAWLAGRPIDRGRLPGGDPVQDSSNLREKFRCGGNSYGENGHPAQS
jgi:D-glycero-D-manno-heptose 1,7-bisphosphate phosphatase